MWIWLLLPIIIVLDQLVKWWVVLNMAEFSTLTLIPNVLDATLIYNTGAFFGVLPEYNNVIAVVAMITVCGIVVYLYLGKGLTKMLNVALILIAAGALSNILDRLIHNAVIDFIYLKFISFPVFNFADISITFGAAMLIWYVIRGGAKDDN